MLPPIYFTADLPMFHLVSVPVPGRLGLTSVTTPAPTATTTATTTEAQMTDDTDFRGCVVDGKKYFFGDKVSREWKVLSWK